jgi:hypothetical protein
MWRQNPLACIGVDIGANGCFYHYFTASMRPLSASVFMFWSWPGGYVFLQVWCCYGALASVLVVSHNVFVRFGSGLKCSRF